MRFRMVLADRDREDYALSSPGLKSKIIESLEELHMELETAADEIANQVR